MVTLAMLRIYKSTTTQLHNQNIVTKYHDTTFSSLSGVLLSIRDQSGGRRTRWG